MNILKNLQPEIVFKYFEDICLIPHGSGNTKKISDYCADFAKGHKLKYFQDEKNNIIIYKNGTKGYEKSKPVIIQGHLDMVCEKEKDCNIDFLNEGLDIYTDGDFIKAKGTTLGGDDGIAVAMALAILDSEDISHPPIEVVLTVDEEIGMLGAAALDYSVLNGRIMLNIDSEEEGHLLTGCAGGVTAICHLPIEYEEKEGIKAIIRVMGLIGGHSGVEINKGRGNANRIIGRILYDMSEKFDFDIISLNGGLKDNAIPREATAEILVNIENKTEEQKNNICCEIKKYIEEYTEVLANEYKNTDKEIKLEFAVDKEMSLKVFTKNVCEKAITALVNLPGGIEKMSSDIENFVQTSLNMGILKTKEKELIYSYCVRSSIESEKKELVQRMVCLMKMLGGTVECNGDYPGWEYKKDSKLRGIMVKIFEKQYGYEPLVETMHAGVECGLFSGNLKGLDCISFGPDIIDIHTPKERLNIPSVERTWKYLLEILKELK